MARSAAAEMHSGFATLRSTYHTNFVVRYTGNIPVPEAAKKEIQRLFTIWDNARQAAKTRLAELGEKDDGFLFGGFSIADAFFWPVLWVCFSTCYFVVFILDVWKQWLNVARTALPHVQSSS
jgi:glutathione S-transferase